MLTYKLRKHFFSKDSLLLSTGVVTFLAGCFLNHHISKPDLELSKQDTAININNNLLTYISAGNKRLLTDLIWVQTLIESDIEHYKKRDLNSWLFLRFNSIATLDPKFYENYFWGGQFLAIVKDDLEGADYLYDLGIQQYPDDYRLNYNAAFLNYYELGDVKKGAQYLEKIVHHPKAPTFLESILNKLKVESGIAPDEVFRLVEHNYNTTKDQALKERLLKDLYAIKAEIDLRCLNNRGLDCDDKDIEGSAYVFRNGKYYSQKPFSRYQTKKRESNSTPATLINTIK